VHEGRDHSVLNTFEMFSKQKVQVLKESALRKQVREGENK